MSKSTHAVTSTKKAWSCPWWHVQQDQIALPNGKQGQYNYVVTKPCVFVVPITTNNELVLIRNYRYPVKQWCWEVPAGSIEAGQTPLQAAEAELAEEIGGKAESIQFVQTFNINSGISSEQGSIFLATGVTLHEPNHDDMEQIEIHTKSIAEVMEMVHSGVIVGGSEAYALLLCEKFFKTL